MHRRVLPFALLLLLLLVGPLTAADRAQAAADQTTAFEAPRELLSDAHREEALDRIQALGVTRLRVLMYWESIAPDKDSRTKPAFDASDPDAYPAANWGPYDRLLASARARNMEVLVTLTGGAPKWATAARRDHITRPDPTEFRRFATAAGTRYRDDVSIWSIWNEPNQPQFLGPQFVRGQAYSPKIYRQLYLNARRGLVAAGNGDDLFLAAETSPRGNQHIVAPLAFLRGTLCLSSKWVKRRACAALPTDGWAHHAYTTSSGPAFIPPSRDDVTIGAVGRLVTALDRAARAKAIPRDLGIYLTEFGIQSKPDPLGVSLTSQAAFINISERLAYLQPRVKWFSQYLLSDDPKSKDRDDPYPGFETGLLLNNGREKPALAAFRLPLVVNRYGKTVALWGRVRPATGATDVEVLYRGSGGRKDHLLDTFRTNARATWAARAPYKDGRRYRVRWTAPDGTVKLSPLTRAY